MRCATMSCVCSTRGSLRAVNSRLLLALLGLSPRPHAPPGLSRHSRAPPLGLNFSLSLRSLPPEPLPSWHALLAPLEPSLLFLAPPEPSLISVVLPALSFALAPPALSSPRLLAPPALSFALAPPALSSLPLAPLALSSPPLAPLARSPPG